MTTIEVKSGYGLDLDTELRMLRVARRLPERVPVDVRTTYLGAHTVPPEFDGDADGYIAFVCDEMLPAVAAEGLADAVDGFCERIAFDAEQIDRVFTTATRSGCASRCTPTSSPTAGAPRSPPGTARCRPTTSSTRRRRHRRPGGGGHGGRAAARCCVRARRRDARRPSTRLRRGRRADGGRDRLQPGDLAAGVAAAWRCTWRAPASA